MLALPWLLSKPNATDSSFFLFLNLFHTTGKWDRALSLLDEMRKAGPRTQPNVQSYTAAIAACGRARKWEEAVALHSKLREEGLTPDQASFNAVIRAARYGVMLRDRREA